MKPKVSVILPFYNAGKTLRKAAQSIIDQQFSDFELLLVDNDSTDDSIAVAKELAKSGANIHLFKEKQRGVAHAMNFGMNRAKGEFLARMDADDVAHLRRLEKQVQYLEENPEIDFVGSYVKYVPHNDKTDGFRRFVEWVNSFYSPTEIEKRRFIEIPLVNPTIMFRRKLFDKFGGCKQGDFPEDYEMQLRYLEAGARMAKIPEPLLEWHDYSTRLTRTDDRYSTEAFFKTKAQYFFRWSAINNPFHPNIWVWGAGRKARQRTVFLEKQGLIINGKIDIVHSKTDSTYYKDIPLPGKIFIVSMVTNTGAGQKIREFLNHRHYVEGKDFMLMG